MSKTVNWYCGALPSNVCPVAISSGVSVGELYPSGGHCPFTCGIVAAAAVTSSTAFSLVAEGAGGPAA